MSVVYFVALVGASGASVEWRIDAIFRRVVDDIPVDANAGAHLYVTTYMFEVVRGSTKEHPSIVRVTVSLFQSDLEKWKQSVERFDRLTQGQHVSITVTATDDAFRGAETATSGDLGVRPDCITLREVEPVNPSQKTAPDQCPPAMPSPSAGLPQG